jgi:hypothetical protein
MQGGGTVADRETEQYIYIIGEHQNGMIAEQDDILAFTRANMGQVETGELALVIANVFGRGQYFPGSEAALSSVVHEYIRRSDEFRLSKARKKDHCTLVTAFKRVDGEIAVHMAAVIPVRPGTLRLEEPETFHQMLVTALPDNQEAFLKEPYAKDSKVIGLIREATLHHINGALE